MFFCLADPESHILFFDIEQLIYELLDEEYALMSPGRLEAVGLISETEYNKIAALTKKYSPDAQQKIAGKLICYLFSIYQYIKNKNFLCKLYVITLLFNFQCCASTNF